MPSASAVAKVRLRTDVLFIDCSSHVYDDGVNFLGYKLDVRSNTTRSTYLFPPQTLLVDVTH